MESKTRALLTHAIALLKVINAIFFLLIYGHEGRVVLTHACMHASCWCMNCAPSPVIQMLRFTSSCTSPSDPCDDPLWVVHLHAYEYHFAMQPMEWIQQCKPHARQAGAIVSDRYPPHPLQNNVYCYIIRHEHASHHLSQRAHGEANYHDAICCEVRTSSADYFPAATIHPVEYYL